MNELVNFIDFIELIYWEEGIKECFCNKEGEKYFVIDGNLVI